MPRLKIQSNPGSALGINKIVSLSFSGESPMALTGAVTDCLVMKLGWIDGRWNVEGLLRRRDQRRQHDLPSEVMAAPAFSDAGLEPRGHVTAFGIERTNVGDVEERTILGRKSMFFPDLLDQGESVAQAPGKDELGVFAPFDSALDEVDEAQDIVLNAVFFQ